MPSHEQKPGVYRVILDLELDVDAAGRDAAEVAAREVMRLIRIGMETGGNLKGVGWEAKLQRQKIVRIHKRTGKRRFVVGL